ncbi:hypothetical protein A4U64_26790 (plasmid) [Rhodococcus sp. WB1]|uniref:hypothetical protein n=1 Tax=Rhodococcus sp. WB1 TaxID=1033922 RepID=UPI00081A3F9D|nr:hypothetical protein [Rhodococcus sp. WB1]ANZ28501.1 hypothetical protein A4U64_26790 [Rhodococcus sp. WB1]
MARIFGEFVAPTTLLTALLFYFGWAHVYWFFDYFGVDSTVLEPSIREYIMRSVDALFVPLIAIAVSGTVLIGGYLALPEAIRRSRHARWHIVALTGAGIAVLINGLSRIFFATPLNSGLVVAPVCIIVGVALLWSASLLRRKRWREADPALPPRSEASVLTEWVVIYILVGLSLFWIATDYSVAVGQTRAREAAAQLPARPTVLVYSELDLHFSRSEVRKIACGPDSDVASAYHYRYDGLVLLTTIGDQYVLLPRTWSPGYGAAIVLPKSPPGAIRFEFVYPSATVEPGC